MSKNEFMHTVGIIGGAGHVGLPLSIVFADSGLRTVIYDINSEAIEQIRQGQMPFMEEGAPEKLKEVINNGFLEAYDKPDRIEDCEFLVMIIGTPVDEHLNPQYSHIHRAIDEIAHCIRNGQILILRSTVFPGISNYLQHYLKEKGLPITVSFCPERVAQGYSLREIRELPQIISAFDPETLSRVHGLFEMINKDILELTPLEAELAKLMTNAWRYIQFSIVNQFYTLATDNGADFSAIFHACRHNYPRMAGVPGPGFAAGPCLIKDTMQLAAYSHNQFVLGHAAMLVNEGLPLHMVKQAASTCDLSNSTAGILGMAFKAESDDPRDSLSYKLKKVLDLQCKRVLCTDPYVRDKRLVSLEQVLSESDIIFLGAPHKVYQSIQIPKNVVVFDVWGFLNNNRKGMSK